MVMMGRKEEKSRTEREREKRWESQTKKKKNGHAMPSKCVYWVSAANENDLTAGLFGGG